jgi:hypothetical protein
VWPSFASYARCAACSKALLPPFPDTFGLGEAKEQPFTTAVNIKSRFSLTVLLLTRRKKADVVFVFLLLFRNPAEVWKTHFSSVKSKGIFRFLINNKFNLRTCISYSLVVAYNIKAVAVLTTPFCELYPKTMRQSYSCYFQVSTTSGALK